MKSQMPWLCPEVGITAGVTDRGTEKLSGILLGVTQQLIMNSKRNKRPLPPCIQPPPTHTSCCQPALPEALCTFLLGTRKVCPRRDPQPTQEGAGQSKASGMHMWPHNPLGFTNAKSRDVAAFEHSLSPHPPHLAPSSVGQTGLACAAPSILMDRGLPAPMAREALLLRHAPLPAVPPPVCPEQMHVAASGSGRPHAPTLPPTPLLAQVYSRAHPESATHKTLPEQANFKNNRIPRDLVLHYAGNWISSATIHPETTVRNVCSQQREGQQQTRKNPRFSSTFNHSRSIWETSRQTFPQIQRGVWPPARHLPASAGLMFRYR